MEFNVNFHQSALIRKSLFYMRLTTIFLLAFGLTASAGGYAQKVTLSVRNAKLEKVFKEIKKQTGYVFFYDTQVLEDAKRVTLNVRDESVEEALRVTLHGQPLDFSIARRTITIFEKTGNSLNALRAIMVNPPQEVVPEITYATITGTVKDAQGNPLAGVSVIVKGTKRGTSTATDGSFSVEANVGDALVFTMVGYQNKEIKLESTKTVNIHMEIEAKSSDEIIVVGYGTQRKENLTGAVTQISLKQVEQRPISNAIEGLRGLVPGLRINSQDARPDRAISMSIRGVNSINGGEPLILIDGVPGDLRLINPNDIESITVLKDAASSAVYGTQAAFGVFLVTTKSGNGAMRFHYSNNFSWIQPMHLPKVEPDILKYIDFQKQAGDDARRPYIDEMTSDYIKERLQNPSLPPIKAVQVNGEWRWLMADNENKFNKVWPQKFQGPTQKHDLSISGSEGKINYYGAFGFLNQLGYLGIGDQSYHRYNVRLKMDYRVKDWLKITYNGYSSNENSLYPSLAKGDDDEPISGEIGLHGINTYETWKSPDGYYMYAPLAAWIEGGNEKRQIAQTNHTIGFEMSFFKNSLMFFGNYSYQSKNEKNENRRVIPLVQTEPNSEPVFLYFI